MAGRGRRASTSNGRGEDPNTTSAETARLWTSAYRELVDFEEHVLAQMRTSLSGLSEPARREIENSNIPMVTQQLQMFQYRLAFWRQRVAELDGA